ncbi:MAG: 30S ribosomal protein S17 [Candidatus Sungbacteria bacterium RIFCSPLOWO2_01_FULL_60_25]|uniref:30S ribosomal protein S17 n=1 Tax=Candidatus Sungbacteria bacterium RIFCSPLOWO2_01_FULL_60_25 TaxID=1802281 RepID=A0A1G2L9J9_9BACT|nr:MAG: 30S ribosomal protein S17 [Candidatus Sungbacteria bacterium RIFCSPLOWO2_01_FULL_60_25]
MRTLQGTIVSNKMTRTVVVRVDRLRRQEKYRTYYRASKRFKADVPENSPYQIGDVVRIAETRPRSRDKRWTVVAVVRRAAVAGVETEAGEVEDKAQ